MSEKELIDVSHVSKRGSSLRITLPKRVVERSKVNPENIVAFYDDEGRIVIEKLE